MSFRLLIIAASVEEILNTFLYRSPALKNARHRMKGKVLRVVLNDFTAPFVLVFSEHQIDVLVGKKDEWEGEIDCSVITTMNTLLKLIKLHERQKQINELIISGYLEVEGDLQVVRNFITLVDLAEFDPAEPLTPYIGDIAAEGVSKLIRFVVAFLVKSSLRLQQYVVDVLTEEWRIAPGPLEVSWFVEETKTVDRVAEALTMWLKKLEGK